MDIIKCLDKITYEIFTIKDMYAFIPELAEKHQENYNIDAKIRQKLQILIKKGFEKGWQQGEQQGEQKAQISPRAF